jgi:tetratricopeptide (TPR) repeat protein
MKKTCHDDGWPKEDNDIKTEHCSAQTSSNNNYALNDTNSQNSTVTQMMVIDSALIGIYLAFMMNSQSLEAIRAIRIPEIITEIGLLLPIIFWFCSVIFGAIVLMDTDTFFDKYKSLNSLKNFAHNKPRSHDLSCLFVLLGLFAIILIAIIAIPFQINGVAEKWKSQGDDNYDQGRINDSIQDYEEAIKLNPDYVAAWNNKGIALRALKKYDAAIVCFEKALKIDKKYVAAWNNKGTALKAQGRRIDDAIACYEKALEIDPQYVPAWNNKGNALKAKGQIDAAMTCYDKIIEIGKIMDIGPQCAAAWNDKANILKAKGQIDAAIACYEKALEIDPQYVVAWNNKGLALFDKCNYTGALTCYETAIGIDQGYALAWSNKGNALKALNRDDEADEAFKFAKKCI